MGGETILPWRLHSSQAHNSVALRPQKSNTSRNIESVTRRSLFNLVLPTISLNSSYSCGKSSALPIQSPPLASTTNTRSCSHEHFAEGHVSGFMAFTPIHYRARFPAPLLPPKHIFRVSWRSSSVTTELTFRQLSCLLSYPAVALADFLSRNCATSTPP